MARRFCTVHPGIPVVVWSRCCWSTERTLQWGTACDSVHDFTQPFVQHARISSSQPNTSICSVVTYIQAEWSEIEALDRRGWRRIDWSTYRTTSRPTGRLTDRRPNDRTDRPTIYSQWFSRKWSDRLGRLDLSGSVYVNHLTHKFKKYIPPNLYREMHKRGSENW